MSLEQPEQRSAVPDVLLERYRLGELPQPDAERIAALVTGDAALRERLDRLDRSDREIAERYPPDQLARDIRARAGAAGRRRRSPAAALVADWLVPAALVAAAILLSVMVPGTPSGSVDSLTAPTTAPADSERIKGWRPALAVYRRTATGSERLADGDVARAGDLIRVGYTAAGRSFGIIVSIDGRGAVTLHLPPNGAHAARLKADPTVLLDQAYELDDAPRWERFYFLTSQRAFDVAPIVGAARQAASAGGAPPAALPVAQGLEQSTFLLQKEAGR